MNAATLTPGELLAAVIIASVGFTMLAVLFALGLGKAAGKQRPQPDPFTAYFAGAELPITRPDLDAAHTAVATAEAIVRAEYEAAS